MSELAAMSTFTVWRLHGAQPVTSRAHSSCGPCVQCKLALAACMSARASLHGRAGCLDRARRHHAVVDCDDAFTRCTGRQLTGIEPSRLDSARQTAQASRGRCAQAGGPPSYASVGTRSRHTPLRRPQGQRKLLCPASKSTIAAAERI